MEAEQPRNLQYTGEETGRDLAQIPRAVLIVAETHKPNGGEYEYDRPDEIRISRRHEPSERLRMLRLDHTAHHPGLCQHVAHDQCGERHPRTDHLNVMPHLLF